VFTGSLGVLLLDVLKLTFCMTFDVRSRRGHSTCYLSHCAKFLISLVSTCKNYMHHPMSVLDVITYCQWALLNLSYLTVLEMIVFCC
jgi:hypothetical protein